ncbi:hypothetical protein ACFCXP_04715 [Streptomyces niveus]|uniref:hypothetical protein n=1 Tax=Streptomyces niveus TaxID=193462 RepID=UPI0035D6BE79
MNCLLCERHNESGGYLCVGCTKDTRVRLESLLDLYRALAAFLTPSPSGPSSGGRSGARAHAPMPVAELPLTMRGPGGMVGVTQDWYTLVREERGMPALVSAGSLEGRLASAVAGLCANLPWISVSWPLAGSFAEEIREVVRAAVSVISPPVPVDRGTRLGPCPADIGDGAVCGAVLKRYTGVSVVTCEWCGTKYPPAMWAGLKVLMDIDLATHQP